MAVSKTNQFVLVDITSLVQGWQSGTIANNGVALAMTTSHGAAFLFLIPRKAFLPAISLSWKLSSTLRQVRPDHKARRV